MENIEKRVHNLICDYITKHIRNNIRVTSETEAIRDIRLGKDVKAILNKALKIIPDNLTVTGKES